MVPPVPSTHRANLLVGHTDDDRMLDVLGVDRSVSAGCTGRAERRLEHTRRGVLQSTSAEALPACSCRDKEAISSVRYNDPACPAATYANGRSTIPEAVLHPLPLDAIVAAAGEDRHETGGEDMARPRAADDLRQFENGWRSYDASVPS